MTLYCSLMGMCLSLQELKQLSKFVIFPLVRFVFSAHFHAYEVVNCHSQVLRYQWVWLIWNCSTFYDSNLGFMSIISLLLNKALVTELLLHILYIIWCCTSATMWSLKIVVRFLYKIMHNYSLQLLNLYALGLCDGLSYNTVTATCNVCPYNTWVVSNLHLICGHNTQYSGYEPDKMWEYHYFVECTPHFLQCIVLLQLLYHIRN